MAAIALPINTQLTERPAPPAMVRFWNPGGASTAAVVSTLPKLALLPEPELYLDQLLLSGPTHGAIRARVKLGNPVEFACGPDDLVLDDDEE